MAGGRGREVRPVGGRFTLAVRDRAGSSDAVPRASAAAHRLAVDGQLALRRLMPVGHAGIALSLVEFVQQVRPTAVLDLGVGYGLTGAILRNYFGHHPTTGAI